MRNRGFTLLELVIVVAIVGILAAAVLPLGRWAVKRQKEHELQQNLRILRNAIDRYHDMALAGLIEAAPGSNGYPPDLETLVEGVELTGEMPALAPGVSGEYSATGSGLTGGFGESGQGAGSFPGGRGFGGDVDQDPPFDVENPGGMPGFGSGMPGFGGGMSQTQRMAEQMRGGRATGASGGRGGFGRADDRRRGPGEEPEKIVFLRRIPLDPLTGDTDWGLRCYGEGPSDRSWCGRNVFDVYTKARGNAIDGRAYREW